MARHRQAPDEFTAGEPSREWDDATQEWETPHWTDESDAMANAQEGTDERPDAAGGARPRRGRRRLRRVLIAVAALVGLLVLTVGGGAWYLVNRYTGNIHHLGDVFASVNSASRPAEPKANASTGDSPVTFLLLGSDTHANVQGNELPGSRSDAIMIARIAGDRTHAQVISIPRDSWVDIPGHGMNKINAAYAFGGPSLLIETVEKLTGVRIDHYAAVSWNQLIALTDQLGGVDVDVAATTSWGPYTFHAGVNHLNGVQARWYVGQRYGLAGGDFDREKRQQNYLRAMFTQLFRSDKLSQISSLDSILRTVTGAVAVDDSLSQTTLLSLAYSARGLKPAGIQFLTAPVLGTGREGAASVVYLDQAKDQRMWTYLKEDSLGENAGEFSAEALAAIPR